ncbi:MAG: hypothetical protein ABH832_03590 [bacterium]
MDSRKNRLLKLITENYIKTAEPVGSLFLLASGQLDCGQATIRNEMRTLEEMGYLTHPHTSAGRVPTQLGYRYYLDNLKTQNINATKKESNMLEASVVFNDSFQARGKKLAKTLVELSNQTAILAFSKDYIYYTGLSNFFSHPEFSQMRFAENVSKVFDHCESCIEEIIETTEEGISVFIGNEHPFGSMLSIVVSRFKSDSKEDGLMALLGPMRMDYCRNMALVVKANELI